jgi:hypothetical protein
LSAGECGGSATEDCSGECGGSAVVDDCGDCWSSYCYDFGTHIPDYETNQADCEALGNLWVNPGDEGDPTYNSSMDCAGECGGSAVEDCAGDCGGSAADLGCGCGEAGPSGCDNACGSTLEFDECGECGGDGIADGACDCDGNVEDCAGDCGGDAVEDECGECGGDGIADGACDCDGNVEDCAGDCGGDAVEDECGVCDGDGIDEGACDCDGNTLDCAGVCGGIAENCPDWSVDLAAYDFDASVTSAVYFDDVNLGDAGDVLAGFVDGEVRGVADASELVEGEAPPMSDIGTYVFFLTIGGTSNGEIVSFQYYDASEDMVLELSETLEFEADSRVSESSKTISSLAS